MEIEDPYGISLFFTSPSLRSLFEKRIQEGKSRFNA